MTIPESIILGLVEGLTEFLPVSSTFHLIVAAQILGLADSDFLKMFEVAIQAGAISALLVLYTRTLLNNHTLARQVLISFVPTAIVGALLYPVIKAVFFSTAWLMLGVFALVGLIFLVVERLVAQNKLSLTRSLASLSGREAVVIGCAQALAVIPGVSRAGSVIVAMMGMGYRRDEATKYTFLLSLPTILAAAAYDVYKNSSLLTGFSYDILVLLTGFATAFVVAYLVVRWLIHYLAHHTLTIFAWYRLGVTVMLYFTLWG